MKKGFKSGLIVLIVLLVIAVGITAASFFLPSPENRVTISYTNSSTYKYNPVKAKAYKNQYIAAVYIEGVIEENNSSYNQEWVMTILDELQNDPNNAGLALYIDSPGGSVYQADEVYLKLLEYKESGKQIYVYQGPMAASGGYYISCAGNQIWANRNTLTGSIGVISSQTVDISGLLENLGISSETIHAGKNKNMGNFNEPLTDEQREILQSIADECYEQFCSIVVGSRHLQFAKVYELADGRIYTASQAKEAGLIDHIGTWDQMLTEFSEKINKPGIKVIELKYEAPWSLSSFTQGLIKSFSEGVTASKTGIPSKVWDSLTGFNSYPAYIVQ